MCLDLEWDKRTELRAGWWVGKNSCSRATTQRDAVSGDILEWRKERKGEMVCGWRRKRDGPNEWDKRDPNALKVGAFQEAVTHLLPRRAEWVFQPLSNFYGRISGAGRGETQMEARNGELMSLTQRMWTFSRRSKVHQKGFSRFSERFNIFHKVLLSRALLFKAWYFEGFLLFASQNRIMPEKVLTLYWLYSIR